MVINVWENTKLAQEGKITGIWVGLSAKSDAQTTL